MSNYTEDLDGALRYGRERVENDLHRKLLDLRPKLAEAAQKEYDAWDASDPEYGDPDVGFGGICHNIAENMADVLNEHGIDCSTLDNNGMGEQHVWVAAHDGKHLYHVDISPHHYETGGGYSWQKKPGVKFTPEHVDLAKGDLSDVEHEDY
jgi:hypothetical protein